MSCFHVRNNAEKCQRLPNDHPDETVWLWTITIKYNTYNSKHLHIETIILYVALIECQHLCNISECVRSIALSFHTDSVSLSEVFNLYYECSYCPAVNTSSTTTTSSTTLPRLHLLCVDKNLSALGHYQLMVLLCPGCVPSIGLLVIVSLPKLVNE